MQYQTNAVLQKIIAQKLISLAHNQYDCHGKSILDVGSGTGFIAQNLIMHGVKPQNITQFDRNPNSLNIAKQFGNIQVADFNKPLHCKQKFDVIFSSMALQWAENLHTTINNIHNLLKQGGRLYLAVPLQGSLKEMYNTLQISPFAFPAQEDIHTKMSTLHSQHYMENVYIALKNIHIADLTVGNGANIIKSKLLAMKHQSTYWNIGFYTLKDTDF